MLVYIGDCIKMSQGKVIYSGSTLPRWSEGLDQGSVREAVLGLVPTKTIVGKGYQR